METTDKVVLGLVIVGIIGLLGLVGRNIYHCGEADMQLQVSRQIVVDTVGSAERLGIVLHIDLHDNWFDLVVHDAWGYPLRGKQEGDKVYVKWAGPDHIWSTEDDVEYLRYVTASSPLDLTPGADNTNNFLFR